MTDYNKKLHDLAAKRWGTRNQYIDQNPHWKTLREAPTREDSEIAQKNVELWEIGQVASGKKPAFISSGHNDINNRHTLNQQEIHGLATKHGLHYKEITTPLNNGKSVNRWIVGKTPEHVDKVHEATTSGDQRALGLALGYQDLHKE